MAEESVSVQYDVAVLEAKPNPLFSEAQRALVRFLSYRRPIPCRHCGRKRKDHWTSLAFFRVAEMEVVTLRNSATEYPPLTPVCRNHILAPSENENEMSRGRKHKKERRRGQT